MNRSDALILTAWVLLPPPILLLSHGSFFLSSILYLVLPSIYFSLRNPKIIPKALIVSLAAMPMMIILDYMAFLNKSWTVPTIFSFRVFQFIPFEDFFFTFFTFYVIIAATNHFSPKLYVPDINKKRLRRSALIVLVSFVIFLSIYIFEPNLLFIPYYDAWLLILAFIIPALMLFAKYSSRRKSLLFIVLYELILFLPYEITAGKLGFWTFPSNQYLAMIHVLGWGFPIEEFLEWMVFFAPAALAFNIFMAGSLKSDRGALNV